MRKRIALVLVGAMALLLAAAARAESAGDLSPDAAGAAASDLRITQSIRQALLRADDLSETARNASITTEDGEVTLRGFVESADEKQRLGAMAQGTPGVGRIRNELQVKGR